MIGAGCGVEVHLSCMISKHSVRVLVQSFQHHRIYVHPGKMWRLGTAWALMILDLIWGTLVVAVPVCGRCDVTDPW